MAENSKKTSGKFTGHIFALVTILVWGVTFLATEQMLDFCTSSQLLMLRFIVAYLVLLVARPRFLAIERIKDELEYIVLAATGVVGYYALENYAIGHGGAENTSILVSFVPIVTLITMCITGQKDRLRFHHFIGFAIAICGVALVVYNGAKIRLDLELSAAGAALGACVCWGVYSVIIGKHTERDPILLARRVLFWALLFIVPFTVLTEGFPPIKPLISETGFACIVILGVLGSGFCYCMWNIAIRKLGIDVATNYIYILPFVTLLASLLLDRTDFSLLGMGGAVLILIGVLISDIG